MKSKAIAEDAGKLHRHIFPNYAHHKEDVLKAYGDRSVAELHKIRKEFDPDGFFQYTVPGEFKLCMFGRVYVLVGSTKYCATPANSPLGMDG